MRWITLGFLLAFGTALGCGPKRGVTPKRVVPAKRRGVPPKAGVQRRCPLEKGPLALPGWACIPKKKRALRKVPVTGSPFGRHALSLPVRAPLVLFDGTAKVTLRPWAHQVGQVERIRWLAKGGPAMGLRFYDSEKRRAWFLCQVRIAQFKWRLLRGTRLAIRRGGPKAIMLLKPLRVRFLNHQGAQVRVGRKAEQPGFFDLQAQLWVSRAVFAFEAKPKPVPRRWTDAQAPGALSAKRRGKANITLRDAPSGKRLLDLELTYTPTKPPLLRRLGRKGTWVKVWYRSDPRSSLAYIGWVLASELHVEPDPDSGLGGLGLGGGERGGGGSGAGGIGFGGWGGVDKTRYEKVTFWTSKRDLPLYLRPDPRAAAVGVLHPDKIHWRPLPLPVTEGKALMIPVKVMGHIFYAPYAKRLFRSFYKKVRIRK